MKIGKTNGYTPGSFSKRLEQTNMAKLNRQAVRRYRAAVAGAGTQLFNTTASASQSKSELVAEQVLVRVQADAQAKLAASVNLGALANVQT
ncbi:MAG: hypothetical protein WD207_07090 [Xanthobacteraceae bacterium]